MDDELEDELVQEIFWAHVSLVSRAARAELLPMADWAAFYVRLYVLRPGTLAVFAALLAVVLLCQSSTEAWLRLLLRRRCELLGAGDAVKRLLLAPPPGSPAARSWEVQAKGAGVFALQGRRPRMEDRFSILSDEPHDLHLYGVFDGHGGEVASEFAEQRLFSSLMPRLAEAVERHGGQEEERLLADFGRLLTQEILRLDTDLLALVKPRRDLSGSTLLVALVHGRRLLVANVGDSRGVLADHRGQATPLSFDHKPHQLKEQRRIRAAGGQVTFSSGVWRVAGVLATSRALGDYPLKDRRLLVAQPDVLTFDLSAGAGGAACAVLASDGLWDALSNEQAAALALAHLDEPLCGARTLATRAFQAGSLDNITALVVDLRGRGADDPAKAQ